MENISDADPDDWFPTEQKKLTKEEKEELREKREQRKRQKQKDPFMLQEEGHESHDSKEEAGEDNKTGGEESGKSFLGLDGASGNDENREKKKGILPVKSPKRAKIPKYSVKKGPKVAKGGVVEDVKEEKVVDDDPLSINIDWDKPIDEAIPHLQPYKRNEDNLKSIQDAIVKKYTDAENAETAEKGKKRQKERKEKEKRKAVAKKKKRKEKRKKVV